MTAGTRVRVGPLDDLPPGKISAVWVGDVSVLLANVGGNVYALRNQCSHEEAPLAEGELDGESIECPWHFSRFCLRTGEVLDPPAMDPVEAYRVEVEGGEIFVAAP